MKKMAAAKPVLGGAVAAQSSPFPLARGRPHLVFTCCLCSSAALGGGVMPARSLPRCVISCSPNIFPPSGRCASCAGIENELHRMLDVVFNEDRNRTRKTTRPRTSRSSESSPSIWCAATLQPHPCARKSNARAGTTPPLGHARSWACSVICDSPPHRGEGSRPVCRLNR